MRGQSFGLRGVKNVRHGWLPVSSFGPDLFMAAYLGWADNRARQEHTGHLPIIDAPMTTDPYGVKWHR